MKLTYRGVSYGYTPANVDMKATDEVGKFRGVAMRFSCLGQTPAQHSSVDLVYRGVAYRR